MSDLDADELKKLNKIFQSISSRFDGPSNNAASFLRSRIETSGLRMPDFRLVVINSDEMVADEFESQIEDQKKWRRKVDKENEVLRTSNRNMLDFIQARCGKAERKRFEIPLILQGWKEFVELLITRVYGGKLPKNWRSLVAHDLDTTVAMLDKWEGGTAGIPPEIIQMLYDHPLLYTDITPSDDTIAPSLRVVAPNKKTAPKMTGDTMMRVAQRLFSGMKKSTVEELEGVTKAQAIGIEWNVPPRWAVSVPEDGDLDWFQVWEMESVLSGGRGWKPRAMIRLGLPETMPYSGDLNQASSEAISAMRQEYFAKSPYHAFERIALTKHTRDGSKIGWIGIFVEMRKEGVVTANSVGPSFAARFNSEHFELFDIYKSTAEGYQRCHDGRAQAV